MTDMQTLTVLGFVVWRLLASPTTESGVTARALCRPMMANFVRVGSVSRCVRMKSIHSIR